MGESIKVGLTYATPLEREKSSETIFSNVGPIPEMYDHSNAEETYFGLMGFLNGAYHSVSKEERLEMILKQLTKYYGNLVFQKMYANGRFIIVGTENSPVYSGYMEGAIRSVKSTSEKTKRVFKAIICKIHLLFR